MALATPRPRVQVIGLGNEHRGDDAAGLLVVRTARAELAGVALASECPAGGLDLLDLWPRAASAIVVDAVRSGRPVGAIVRVDLTKEPLPEFRTAPSTHGLSLGQSVELARALGRRPSRLVAYGIEGARFDLGAPPSPEVEAAIGPLARRICAEARAWAGTPASDRSDGPEAADA